MPVHGKVRQEDQEFEASLGYMRGCLETEIGFPISLSFLIRTDDLHSGH